MEINANNNILMVFLSANIVAPDLWLSFLAKLNQEGQKNKTYLSVFVCLVGACFVFTTIRAYGFLLVSLNCAQRLHDKMVVAILQAPVLFFDTNPVGRILNLMILAAWMSCYLKQFYGQCRCSCLYFSKFS